MPRNRPRHDHDAGGPAELLAAKAELRDEVWAALRAAGANRFPAPEGRIPNFVGAEAAAERLRGTEVWRNATTLKANPDSPQWPVRQRALEDGKLVFMAVPRLAGPEPFFLLDPQRLAGSAREASSIKGASKSARPVGLDRLQPVDLVVAGTVAAGLDGARLGKGGGFSDLEFAVASEAGLIGPDTVVATTVHEAQVLPAGEIPTADHDIRLDLIVTPERVIEIRRRARRRPARISWDDLTDEKIAAIPLLARLRAARR
jgi:5-formyltetrahydrofolate cyclo-ligase